MPTVREIGRFLEDFAPLELAESWDNVGLLVGDPNQTVRRIMTCLTVTPDSADEAVRDDAHLIVTHHPLPFHALTRVTTETLPGRLLLQLIRHGTAIYSPHTCFDSAPDGINQRLAEMIGLVDVGPLVPQSPGDTFGAGRHGHFPEPLLLETVAQRLHTALRIEHMQCVRSSTGMLRSAAVACGSAGEFLKAARTVGCDLLVLGETNLHTCIEAEAMGISLLLTGHFASERFAVEHLATVLQQHFPDTEVWASRRETDPLRWIA